LPRGSEKEDFHWICKEASQEPLAESDTTPQQRGYVSVREEIDQLRFEQEQQSTTWNFDEDLFGDGDGDGEDAGGGAPAEMAD
jgi:hypothetical protein